MSAPATEPVPTTPPAEEPWSRRTRDRWFFGALALATIGVLYLFSWFLNVLLFSGVVVVVTWPLYRRVLARCRGRRMLASLLTVAILAVAVFVPVGYLGFLFAREAVALATTGAAFVSSGELTRLVERLTATTWLPDWVQEWLPVDFDLLAAIARPLQDAALSLLNWAGNSIPALLGLTMNAGVDVAIFFLAVVTLYAHGPRVLQVIKDLSPMDDAYEERLFAVFGEFANNVVLGSFATAAVQGTVAGVGYAIAGVDRVVFFAILTGLCGFVPLVGTALVLVPLAIVLGLEHGLGWAVFLLAWAVGVAQLDNVIRPLFMRGRANINPLLIFLAVFAGLGWLGLPGALLGPAIVAAFLSLYTIYAEDYLGRVPEVVEPPERRPPGWLRRVLGRGRDLEKGPAALRADAEDVRPSAPGT